MFGIAVLGLVVLAVRSTPGLNWVALLLGAPATALLLIQAISRSNDLLPYSSALVAWAFAYTYTVVQAIEPESFTAAIDPKGDRSWMELLFLSFTTLTSTGLSDVVPVKAFARGVSMVEQLAGLSYVAVLVSRLVGLTLRRPA